MDMEPVRITDADRERAAGLLQRACGEGRLTLEEFSVRVGAVWAADTAAELAVTTADLAPAPPVGGNETVERITNVFGENRRHGRWKAPRKLRVRNVFGSVHIDLCEAVTTGLDVLEITGVSVFGEVKVYVPEGVEVETSGAIVFASRSTRLAPVPRLAGTPVVRVHINSWFSEVQVRSRGPASSSPLARWARQFLE